jgi:hypothetical protein
LPQVNATIEDIIYGGGDNAWAGWEKNEKNKFGPRFSNMKATMDPQVYLQSEITLDSLLLLWFQTV